jgi:hypothetical protein
MMQILVIGAVLIGGWYAWKALKREMARVDAAVEAARKPPSESLERDPETGRYRPREKE